MKTASTTEPKAMAMKKLSSMLTTTTSTERAKRWLFALFAAMALFVSSASAQAATASYNFAFPSQTWGRPPAGANCNGAKTTTTYATLTITLYGTVTVTATRSSGTGISLTTYQNSVFPTSQCANFWDTTNVSTTNTVSRSLTYNPAAPFNFPSTFVFVVSGNSATDLANFTVTTTTTNGTTSALVCNPGTNSPTSVAAATAGGNYSFSYTPPVGEIGCDSWNATTTSTWVKNISPSSGTGTGTIAFSADANATGVNRSSQIAVGGASLSVTQAGGPVCNYSLSATSASAGAAASSGSFTINTTAGCAWSTATSGAFVSGVTASGSGTGTVSYNVAANTGPARSATITAGGKTFTINQDSGCSYALSASSGSATAAGGGASVTVTPSNSACTWTATSNSEFLTGVTASGTGTGTVSYSVAANAGIARSGTLTIGGQTFTVNQASGCTFTVAPNSVATSSAAGAGSLAITASNAACPWTATNNDAWLAVSPSSGTGSQSVTYNVGANVGPSRAGSLTVAGQTVPFNQAGGCTASLSGTGTVVGGSGGSSSVTLTMSSPACAWTASSSAPWVTVPASGAGSGTVTFTVAAQAGPARTATLTIAGQTFSVEQSSACSYAITPASASVGAAAGTGTVQVTTSDPACTWTVGSNTSWLASTSTSGTGSQAITYDYGANVAAGRSGTMTIAGKTFSVTQADGCVASLSPTSSSVGAAGTNASFAITMSAPTCTWSASSPSGFVTGVTASGTGSGTVAFTVSANSGPARAGSIIAGGATFSINQASGCLASLGSTSANAVAAGGSSSVALTMSAATCPWTATSNASWLGSVTAGGTGSGSVAYTAAPNTGLARTGTLTVAGHTFTVQQADGCSFVLSTTQASAAAAGDAGSISVTASNAACSFTASSQASWLTGVTSGATGSGNVSYTVAANPGQPRSGTLLIAGQTVTIQQATGCVATLSTQAVPATATGGSATIGVTLSSPSCTWTAAANQPFLSNVAYGGTGSGSVTFDIAANAGVARTGSVTVAGKTVTVTQADGCLFTLNPTGAQLQPQGVGPFTFALNASDASCPWTMQGNDSWVSVNTPSGTGSSSVSYSTTANLGPTRSSNIDVGGRTFTVLQGEGCQATVTPGGTIELSAEAQSTQFHLTLSAPNCTWTAASNNSWLSVADAGGTGNGDVHFSVQANSGPERTVQVQLKGGQSVTVRQASGCAVALPATDGAALASGGTATFNVGTVAGCAYTAETSDAWISGITVTAQGISYDVAPSTEVKRVGTITVKSTTTASSATYTVTQASGCVLVLPSGGSAPSADGGPANFAVQTVAGCAFTAAATDAWLQPVTVSNGTVLYQAAINLGPARTGTIAVTSTDTGVKTLFAVSQASGCDVSLVTSDVSLAKAGGQGSFGITTGAGCGINLSSPNDWLSGFTLSQGLVTFNAAANVNTDRIGTIVVKAPDTGASATFTVREASGCVVTLPVASAEVGITGGDFKFDVTTGSGCGFKTSSDADWLQGVGEISDGVSFTAQENTGVARTSTITVTAVGTNVIATYIVHQSGPITQPVIGTQPIGVRLVVGGTLRLEVVATGGDLHYQWRKNGVDIPGATAVEYRVMSTTADDSGSYDVVVTNAAGSVTSSTAAVVVTTKDQPGGGGTGGEGGAAGTPDDSAGASTGGSGAAGAPEGDAGEAPDSSARAGAAGAAPYVGGGDCSCSLIGGSRRNVEGVALGLLMAAVLVARRRRNGAA